MGRQKGMAGGSEDHRNGIREQWAGGKITKWGGQGKKVGRHDTRRARAESGEGKKQYSLGGEKEGTARGKGGEGGRWGCVWGQGSREVGGMVGRIMEETSTRHCMGGDRVGKDTRRSGKNKAGGGIPTQ